VLPDRGITFYEYLGCSSRGLVADNLDERFRLDHFRKTHKFAFSDRDGWAVVLAGGDGTRLQSLTRNIAGDFRPKQFCRLFGGKTLLRQTRDRIEPLFPGDRTLIVVTRTHERFYADELSETGDSPILVQPQNQGTGVAIITGILRILQAQPDAVVAFFPSDHYYSNDRAFRAVIGSARRFARKHSKSVILLGAEAHAPEVEYGWIEPGRLIGKEPGSQLLRVNRFWETPSLGEAQSLLDARCLWNTFVAIGRASAFLDLLNSQIPDVVEHISRGLAKGGLDAAYLGVRAVDFSREVLV
jgi:mannose-1-phosphate guanylyltransferase